MILGDKNRVWFVHFKWQLNGVDEMLNQFDVRYHVFLFWGEAWLKMQLSHLTKLF